MASVKYLVMLAALSACSTQSQQVPASWASAEVRERYERPQLDLGGLGLLLWLVP